MRLILCILLIMSFYSFGKECGGPEQRRCSVSVINLVATPERYHDKQIVVKGYIDVGRKGVWLSFFNGSFDTASMIYIDVPEKFVNSMALKHQGSYIIAGIFEYCGQTSTGDKECYNSITPVFGENGEPVIVSIKSK